jgi:osmoprotectant transport system permease protein
VVLSDPKQAIPPYDAVILLSPKRAADPKFVATLHPLVGAIPVETMRKANLSVDRDEDKQTPAQAADTLAKAIGR